jgi:thiamine-monophosphate kinase
MCTEESVLEAPEPMISDIGEFGLIREIIRRLPQSASVLVGPGDDAAVVAVPDGQVAVSTDVLVEAVHFRIDWSTAYQIGRKAAAASLADIAAMGGTTTAIVVGLAIRPDLPVSWVCALADGLRDECDLVGASVCGGDVVRSDLLMVAVTAIGDLPGRSAVSRSGARPGDRIVLAGRLGWAAAGYDLLSLGWPEVAAGWREDIVALAGEAVDRHRCPLPPYDLGPQLAAAGATSLCDVSDGLLADLEALASASGVVVEVNCHRWKPDPALKRIAAQLSDALTVTDPWRWVLTGGEDHALLATVPPRATLPRGVREIGTVRQLFGENHDGPRVVVAGRPGGMPSGPMGHDHFASRTAISG